MENGNITKSNIIEIIEEARDFAENWSENELSEKLSNVIYYLFENLNW